MAGISRRPRIVYEIEPVREDWVLADHQVPESRPHDLASKRVHELLVAWARRTGRRAMVCRNLAIRWDESRPPIGVDPDVCVLETVKGWLFATAEGRSLHIADDEAGTSWWTTPEQSERAAKERERAEWQAERAAKERAERQIALFSAKLRELGVDPETFG